MKAIIEIAPRGNSFQQALAIARKADKNKPLPTADYHLSFADPRQLFAELTPARLTLLDTLKHKGPMSIYALAGQLGRNYSNVHRDCSKLLEYQLVEKDANASVFVPWDEILIRLSVGHPKAA